MKTLHIRFISPLHGRIFGEDVFQGTPYESEGFELKADSMARLYDQCPRLSSFLQDNTEDLSQFIPEELQEEVLKITMGDYGVFGSEFCLIHHVWFADDDPEPELLAAVKEYLQGQLSDGWGEGLEQRAWQSETVRWNRPYFDEWCMEFDSEECQAEVDYFVDPSPEGIRIEEMDREEDDLAVEVQKVAEFDRIAFDGFLRTIYLVSSSTQRNLLCTHVNTDEARRLATWNLEIEQPTLIAIDNYPEAGERKVFAKYMAMEIQTPTGVRYALMNNGNEEMRTDLKYAVATMLTA